MNTTSPTLLVAAIAIALCGADALTGGDGEPTNDLPNPYQTVAVDAKGNVYGGEVGPRQLVKHLR